VSDANVTAFFCPYNAATSCMEEGMYCPNYTSNPVTHETWSEECLEVCAALLAAKMDLSDLDTRESALDINIPLNVPILNAGGVEFDPKEIQVGVERVITFKGGDVKDGEKAVFLPAGDHTCSGADTVSEFMSGVIKDASLTVTFPATGSYKLCISFPSVFPGGEDTDFELANILHLEVVGDENMVSRGAGAPGGPGAPGAMVPPTLPEDGDTKASDGGVLPCDAPAAKVVDPFTDHSDPNDKNDHNKVGDRSSSTPSILTMATRASRAIGSTTVSSPSPRAPCRLVRRCRSRSLPRALKTAMSASLCRSICRLGTRSLPRRTRPRAS